jgi:hypothetical protein
MIARLICKLLYHGKRTAHEDGKGAAWETCNRCGAVTSSWSWHGGRPWE